MDLPAVRKYIAVIERALALLKASLDGGETSQVPPAEISPPTEDSPPSRLSAREKHVQDLLAIDCWPEAVKPHLVVNQQSDEDQINRANAVLDMMLTKSLEGRHFLDFGCGDGWIAREAKRRGAASSTGLDLLRSPVWDRTEGVNFTTQFTQLPKGHFDVVFLYDVLDHCHDPFVLLDQVRLLMKQGGMVYVRCHPWCSRHASHLYKQGLNKAYIHLFLNLDELRGLGYEPLFTRQEKNCLESYNRWLRDFQIKKERVHRSPVNGFFHVPAFVDLLANEQRLEGERREGFLKDMEIDFVDYFCVL